MRRRVFDRPARRRPGLPSAALVQIRPTRGIFRGAVDGAQGVGQRRDGFEVVPLGGRNTSEGEAMGTDPSHSRSSAERRSSGSRPLTRPSKRSKSRAPEVLRRRHVDACGNLNFVVARLRTVFGTVVTAELALRAQAAERDIEIADCLREGVSVPLAAQLERLSRIAEHEQRVAAGSASRGRSKHRSTSRRGRAAGQNPAGGVRRMGRARHAKV